MTELGFFSKQDTRAFLQNANALIIEDDVTVNCQQTVVILNNCIIIAQQLFYIIIIIIIIQSLAM